MSNPELKPCPFCGGEAVLDDEWIAQYSVFCENNACRYGRNGTRRIYDTRDEAIAAWNRRATS